MRNRRHSSHSGLEIILFLIALALALPKAFGDEVSDQLMFQNIEIENLSNAVDANTQAQLLTHPVDTARLCPQDSTEQVKDLKRSLIESVKENIELKRQRENAVKMLHDQWVEIQKLKGASASK